MNSPVRATGEGVVVTVRLAPRGSADAIEGVADSAVKIRVKAPPVDGAANDALVALLAREWRLPRRSFSLVGGARSRLKRVAIAGESAALMALITRKLAP